ncbi:hypothetical protein PM082_021928 [Marasmius tenuissimus]|nr:hypothetical protein PM082_021928 [Marasmius tenuissimus]
MGMNFNLNKSQQSPLTSSILLERDSQTGFSYWYLIQGQNHHNLGFLLIFYSFHEWSENLYAFFITETELHIALVLRYSYFRLSWFSL